MSKVLQPVTVMWSVSRTRVLLCSSSEPLVIYFGTYVCKYCTRILLCSQSCMLAVHVQTMGHANRWLGITVPSVCDSHTVRVAKLAAMVAILRILGRSLIGKRGRLGLALRLVAALLVA